jgi:putative transposase
VTRFAFVDAEKAHYPIVGLCRLLKVSRSGYYAWAARLPSARAVADGILTAQIHDAFDVNRRVYGAPRIHAELADAAVHVGRKRIARLMRQAGIVGCHRRKRSFSITRQNPDAAAAPDLVDRKFTATEPNQLWVADVTYVPTVQGWLYLACVTDVFSRMILGWSMAHHRKTDLVVDAVTMAVHRRGGKVPGVIHHSDRGGEGGFNWSSQHLDDGGARWVVAASKSTSRFSGCRRVRGGSGLRIGRCGRRCVRRAGRSRLVRCSGSSGA